MMVHCLGLIALSVILTHGVAGIYLHRTTNLTTPNLVKASGYPFEEHKVTTKDGYILTLHRIPYSTRLPRTNKKLPIIFLQHGIIASSTDWVGLGPPDALAYLLSDNGYDIWMGNSRGNQYSLQHVKMTYLDPQFWNFDWHEMGVYDLPAVFDYVLRYTGVPQLQYVAHSQGTTEFFVYCSTLPSCKRTVKAAHLFAPVAFTEHTRFPLAAFYAPILGQGDPFINTFGSFNFLPDTDFLTFIIQWFCADYSNIKSLCGGVVTSVVGQSNYLNDSIVPFLAEIYPEGSSFKQILHFLQGYNGYFRQYNYGKVDNMKLYGSPEPPEYNLKNYHAPSYLYYGASDFLSVPIDVFRLVTLLPRSSVRSLYRVSPKKWNHLDFLYGIDIKTLLYDELLKNIKANERGYY